MTGSSFPAWLAAQAADRADRGLSRRLVHSDSESLLDLAGNDYLGLARDPRVVAGAVAAARSYGAGAGASQGGLVLGSPEVREHLVNRARPFIYDTGLAPAAAGAALAALRVLKAAPELAGKARANAAIQAGAAGVTAPAGAVLSVPMPGPRQALTGVETAARHGLRIGCLRPRPPPDGVSRLRLTAHAHHTDSEGPGGRVTACHLQWPDGRGRCGRAWRGGADGPAAGGDFGGGRGKLPAARCAAADGLVRSWLVACRVTALATSIRMSDVVKHDVL